MNFAIFSLLLALASMAAAQDKAAPVDHKIQLDFGVQALTEPLMGLTASDQRLVDQAIQSIRMNDHGAALSLLSGLSASNPMNSGVRLLRAYVLLELGNLAGALSDARTAESSGAHSAYRCWFLAQVAYAAGNKPLCRREIKHVSADPAYTAKAAQLKRDLDTRK